MRLNHNMASLNIFRTQVKNLQVQNRALNNLSSGQKVVKAKDNPNTMSQSQKMEMQIRGLQMANKNVQDGVSMFQNVDGALDSVTSMLQRVRELTVQSGGSTDDGDRQVIQNEIDQLVKGIDDSVKQNEFNGVKLINNTSGKDSVSMTVGSNAGEKVQIPLYNLTTDSIGDGTNGKKVSEINVTVSGGLDEALGIVDGAIKTVNAVRSKYGALQNGFETLASNLDNLGEVVQGSQSNLIDSNMAEEMMNFSKSGLLVEAGTAMMAQSNKLPQDILSILSKIK